jgi:hypothetical protein
MTRVAANELDYRESGCMEVSLLWDRDTDELIVSVRDRASDDSFEIVVENNAHALDVFNHPYAYAPEPVVTSSPGHTWERDSGRAPTGPV